MAAVALVAIAIATALVIAAWKFGGPEGEAVPGLQGSEHAESLPRPGPGPSRRRRDERELVDGGAPGSTSGKLLYPGTLERGQHKSFDGRSLQLALARRTTSRCA